MTWFEQLTGFPEADHFETQARLKVDGDRLVNARTGETFGMGRFELVSLGELRGRLASDASDGGRLKFSAMVGDAGALHREPELSGAVFQAASQFNLLEMIGPDVTPEHGVADYAFDRTQGPACAMAAGAGTIFRNYLVEFEGGRGQTRTRQLNGLAGVGLALSEATRLPVGELWRMSNGYCLATRRGLEAIDEWLADADEAAIDGLRTRLAIGLHHDVEVTTAEPPRQTVTQAYCSAMPLGYSREPRELWSRIARLVLEALYEATLMAGALNAARGVSPIVLLTRVGGGVFRNDLSWIDAAILRAVRRVRDHPLDVRLVCWQRVDEGARRLEAAVAEAVSD